MKLFQGQAHPCSPAPGTVIGLPGVLVEDAAGRPDAAPAPAALRLQAGEGHETLAPKQPGVHSPAVG